MRGKRRVAADSTCCSVAMRARTLAALLALCTLAAAQESDDLTIGVVEDTGRAAELAAAAEGALRAGGGGVRVNMAPVPAGEPLAAARHVCELAARGAAAALLGGGAHAAAVAREAAARAGLPLLLVEPAEGRGARGAREALHMYPHGAVLARAAADLCREKGWPSAVLLHSSGAAPSAWAAPDARDLALPARALPSPSADPSVLRNLMLVLKKMSTERFVVWCDAACTRRALDAAQRAGLAGERHSFLLLAPDLRAADLAPYSHGGANVTALRLFAPPEDGSTARLLAHSAATLAQRALLSLRLPPRRAADCAAGRAAFHADTLLNYLRSEEWQSNSTNSISWEADGYRRDFDLEVCEVARGGGLTPVGVWSARGGGVAWARADVATPAPAHDSMANRTFNVLIALNKPYIMRSESTGRLTGNQRYEGFCIELIEKLGALCGFNYTFIEMEDGSGYGKQQPNGEWNGMLGRLMRDESIEFAITDLTITAEREKAVDFTTPFMNLGISILFRKPEPPKPQLFAFLLPFSNGVWLGLGLAYLGSSLVLYVVGRLCHEEWQNPYPCIEEPPALENQFTLGNALWFNLGAVLLQGSEIAPVAYGTRAVASSWWLFALVITSSYTANLATLLAKKTPSDLIHDVTDLAKTDLNIDYGAKNGGSTYTYFEQSKSETYMKLFEHMKTQRMPESNEEGINKVTSNDTSKLYAFFMESTSIEYEVERNCQLTKVGELLDSKGYGIAMRKDSKYRQALNLALLNLQEKGVLREMKNTWWNEKHGGGACKAPEEFNSQELGIANFRGLFLVLAVGCALGVALSALDLCACAARRARAARQTFCHTLAQELRFVFHFENSVKPLQGSLNSSSAGSSPPLSVEGETEGDAEERVEGEGEDQRARSGSRRRRRSSMHAASLRVARHTARDSATPAPNSPRHRSLRH